MSEPVFASEAEKRRYLEGKRRKEDDERRQRDDDDRRRRDNDFAAINAANTASIISSPSFGGFSGGFDSSASSGSPDGT